MENGHHAEMLAWVKSLVTLRRGNICLNDGDLHHISVFTDDKRRTLVMQRDEARVVINFGQESYVVTLLEGEEVKLISRDGVCTCKNTLELPPMTLAVLMSSTEALEDRQVALHGRDGKDQD
jgi:maltooligosyltrehalose trehalohydrolase